MFQIQVEGVPIQNYTIDDNLIDGYIGYEGEIYGHDYVEGDPKFVNYSGADFHLKKGSPAIDNGSAVDAPGNDFDGNPRPQGAGYDIGCYEFISPVKLIFIHRSCGENWLADNNGGDVNTNDLGWETGNHHRWWNGTGQHIQTVDNNFSAFGSNPWDSHPTAAGNQKASGEFVQLLNVFLHEWMTPAPSAFDTGAGNINVNRLYTYPCAGTGGRT